jgi:FkbM family methyltransferase
MQPYVAFILANTKLGSMIFNRFDVIEPKPGYQTGVGAHLFHYGDWDEAGGIATCELLSLRRAVYGDGLEVLDIGANVGAHTLRWARHMDGWGRVTAFEPQERVFYALAGNIALNNCFNAFAVHAAVGSETGTMNIPTLDHRSPANFGGLKLTAPDTELGQPVDYFHNLAETRVVAVDSLCMARVDFIKIDVEGMELNVLKGARNTVKIHHPVIFAEHFLSGLDNIKAMLEGYVFMQPCKDDDNVLCIHKDDKVLEALRA